MNAKLPLTKPDSSFVLKSHNRWLLCCNHYVGYLIAISIWEYTFFHFKFSLNKFFLNKTLFISYVLSFWIFYYSNINVLSWSYTFTIFPVIPIFLSFQRPFVEFPLVNKASDFSWDLSSKGMEEHNSFFLLIYFLGNKCQQ